MDDVSGNELLRQARLAAKSSYSPYSRFRVGSVAVSGEDIYVGTNIENAAYGSTICAEANAIAAAVTNGVRHIDTVAVVSLDATHCFPCGNCRQLMREFNVRTVIVGDDNGEAVVYAFEELLPHSFGKEDLQ